MIHLFQLSCETSDTASFSSETCHGSVFPGTRGNLFWRQKGEEMGKRLASQETWLELFEQSVRLTGKQLSVHKAETSLCTGRVELKKSPFPNFLKK